MMLSASTSCMAGYFAGSSSFLYFLTNERGECIYANSYFTHIISVSDDFFLLTNFFESPDILLKTITDSLREPGHRTVELVLTGNNGERINTLWEFSSCRKDNDEAVYVQAIGSIQKTEAETLGARIGKIADRYKAYEQSREGLWRFESEIPVSIYSDPDAVIEHWQKHSYLAECNNYMAQMYGYEKAADMVGMRLAQMIDFSDKTQLKNLKKFIQNRFRTTLVETREFDRHGNIKFFLNSMEGVIKNGMISCVWGTQQDITEQKLAEEKISYLAQLMQNVSDVIISFDTEMNIVTWNNTAEQLLGYTSAEMSGRKIPEQMLRQFMAENPELVFREVGNEGVWNGEASIQGKNGKTFYFLTTFSKILNDAGVLTGYLSVSKDITALKKAKDTLARSEAFYRTLIAESQDGIVLTDNKGNIVFAAPSIKKALGYEPADVTGKNIFDFVHPEEQLLTADAFQKEINYVKQPVFINARLLKKNGEWLWCIVRGHNMINNPDVGFMVIYFFDDMGRKLLLDELRIQATTLSSVFDLIITCDFDYKILSWNKRAEQVVGYTEQEAVGKFLGDLVKLDYGKVSADEVAAIMEKKGNWQGEISFVNRSGVKKTVLHTASYLLNDSGQRVAIIGTGIDITEKKAAEEKVYTSELFFRNIFINSLDAVFITDPNGIIKFVSPSVNSILGYTPEELAGKITFEYAHPDDRQLAMESFKDEVSLNPKRKFISVRIRNKRGDWVWCIVRGHNLLQNPYINGMVVYLFDDSLRKQTEQALIESENKFRTQAALLSNVTDVIITTDLNRVITSWNSIIEKMSGISPADAVGKMCSELVDISYHPFTDKQVASIVKNDGIWKGEVSFTGAYGEKKYLLQTISLLRDESGKETGMMEVGKDITERKKVEARLQQSEIFYRSLAANSLDGIVLTNKEGIIIHCAPSVRHVSGYEVEQLLGRNIFEFIHPDDQRAALEAFGLELNRQSVLNYIVIRLLHATRGWVWCTVRGHNLLHNPVLNALVIYFADDTKRKQIEDRLRESESRFRNMIHNLKLGVLLQNEKAEVLVCNNAALEMLGLTEEQLIGKSSFDTEWNVIHEDGSPFPGDAHPVPTAIEMKKPVRDVVMGVYRPLTGDRVWLLVNAEPILDEEGNILNVICSFADITEQRRMSQQLIEQEIQKQKLITQATIDAQEKERQEIGKELHDNINQHLTTTRLYLEVAAEKSKGDVLDLLSMANKNLGNIVSEIRKLSQSLVPPTLGDIGLIESVQDLCDSLKRTHSFQVDFLHRHFSESGIPDNMKLMIFRIIQEQISNIIRHSGANAITIKLQSDAEFIIFSIEDNGQGFDPQHHKKGMGLKNIANRVALFDGRVDIESAPGNGCSVTVSIPVPAVNGLFN